MDQEIQAKEEELEDAQRKLEECERQIDDIGKASDNMERQLTTIKAKEYDKVDFLKRCAELEARIKYLSVDNENLVKERNNLDIANVTLVREKTDLEQNLMQIEAELDYFRTSHEEHLDKFDSKFETITTELSKLKNENIQLKEKEKHFKRQVKDLEENGEDLKEAYLVEAKKNETMSGRMHEMERDIRMVLQEREREMKEGVVRQSNEEKQVTEEKGRMLGDIQNMIKTFKDDKKGKGYLVAHKENHLSPNLVNSGHSRDGGYY
jgi:chromosome segregation ATPase